MSHDVKAIINSVNDAFLQGNNEAFIEHCADNIRWTMVGETVIEGKQALREFMTPDRPPCPPPRFTVDTLIVEGDHAVAHGPMEMANAEGETGFYRYCDVYRFDGAGKIAELTSYVIKTK
jgi:ketosteroid isomerase-like protein